MNKFVILAFGFLGLGFYELSGGADFDPQATRTAVVETRLEREAARKSAQSNAIVVQTLVPAATEDRRVGSAETDGNRAATDVQTDLNLVSFSSVVAPQPPVSEVKTDVETASLAALAQTAVEQNAPLDLTALAPAAPPAEIVAFAGNAVVASSFGQDTERDLRSVKGSLVNMRSGPGTEYEIVDQLQQATRVEVLTDTGNGWVELRPIDGGATGWIAAFLLTEG